MMIEMCLFILLVILKMIQYPVIVIGSGLAGLVSAIHFAELHPTQNVIVFEKSKRVGGNSARATSGLSATNSSIKVKDTWRLFYDDMAKFKPSNPQVLKLLAQKSTHIIRFLKDRGICFDSAVQTGGHSVARTFTVSNLPYYKNIGKHIIDTLRSYIKLNLRNVKIKTRYQVERVSMSPRVVVASGNVVRYDKLVIACGGYSGCVDIDKLDIQLRTNDASGDALRFAKQIGVAIEHVSRVQIHPTCFKNGILCPESFRSWGAILVDINDNPISNIRTIKNETRKKLVSKLKRVKTPVFINVPLDVYNKHKSRFKWYVKNNLFQFDKYKQAYVAQVKPALHFTLGGLRVNPKGQVLTNTGKPLRHVYACGEAVSIFGTERLCGCGLLSCTLLV
jgi:fumarate reductase flavoprotein subunit